ncbi:MAG TPA: DUF1289 domain-containing protein [Steroidobacteraceae bacterium]|nr:DUF1289 domain-containing protein [Steroidobacteraceae bacterium]
MSQTAPASPCINICSLDDVHGYCVGCYRTIDEIARWGDMTPTERWAVLHWAADRASERALRLK